MFPIRNRKRSHIKKSPTTAYQKYFVNKSLPNHQLSETNYGGLLFYLYNKGQILGTTERFGSGSDYVSSDMLGRGVYLCFEGFRSPFETPQVSFPGHLVTVEGRRCNVITPNRALMAEKTTGADN
ncbi:hypothetical protein CDAR_277771 [Caerostris darwini]|uniref:Uncharacterized protein n=1 Tax=Caerostris darwini TaxID=1538125 RepID=A0AAV4VA30_9ARAC|nr:hypothetical protein CDAR_277771 [Caerostris darwini]